MHSKLRTSSPDSTATWLKVLRAIGNTIVWSILGPFTLWAVAALYVDVRIAVLRIPLTLIYVLGIFTVLFKLGWSRWAAALCLAGFYIVLAWWLTLTPSNDSNWQSDVDRTAWAEIDGDRIRIHNLRNCDYHTETDYANCGATGHSISLRSGRPTYS